MICGEIPASRLHPNLPKTRTEAFLQLYVRESSPELGGGRNPAVLILPGGGYEFTSDREAEPVALQFTAAGYSAFVLRYSCAPDRYPAALLQTAAAVAHLRAHADEYHIDAGRIAVCGFSAGGHLAASAGILWKDPVVTETLGLRNGENRPDAMILCYPVVSAVNRPHAGSFENLLGGDASEEALRAQSLERRVGPDTVPAFIWHTFSDEMVPVENSLELARSLRAAGVPFEFHIYPEGQHGLSLCSRLTAGGNTGMILPHVGTWMPLCLSWLDGLFGR